MEGEVVSRPTSWMITCIATGEVFEVFSANDAAMARKSTFVRVETAIEYLGRINKEIKADGEIGNE